MLSDPPGSEIPHVSVSTLLFLINGRKAHLMKITHQKEGVMKRIFCSIMILFLLGAPVVNGQNPGAAELNAEKVLVSGNPSLTEGMVSRMIELFEWGLDGKFTKEQRIQFRQQRMEEWHSKDRKSMNNVVELLKFRDLAVTLSNAERQKLHAQFQAGILETLRKQPEDNTARLLLSVYDNSHHENALKRGESFEQERQNGATGSFAPPALAGTWQAGTVSATTFVNPNTGSYAAPSGTQVRYRIFPDGRYEYASLTQQSSYNCTMKLMTYKTGMVNVQGSQLVFIPQEGKFTSEDNCNRQYNYEKPATLEREAYEWRVERDQYGVKLCLQNAKVNGCAYKQ